ncbi:MAG: tetratricopeptide repeat protein [Symploca sp. SIO1B1]|nr:tetratricopeptide repeat protein [Symploca sp. SIO1B1]
MEAQTNYNQPTTHLAQAQTNQDQEARANQLYEEALQLWQKSQFPEALEKLEQALGIYQEISDRQGQGDLLTAMGAVYTNLGQYPQALDYFKQALAIRQELGDRVNEGILLNNLGIIYDNLAEYQQALDYHQQALVLRQEIGDRLGEGKTLNNLGAVYLNLGQYQQALDYFQQALTIKQELDDPAGVATSFNNLGAVYNGLGEYRQSLDSYQQALALMQELGDRTGEGTALNNLGTVYLNFGQYQQALEHFQPALVIAQELSDRAGEGTTLHNLGAVYLHWGQYQQALDNFQQALAIRQEIGARAGVGTTLTSIGLVYDKQGEYQQALDSYQQALVIAQEIGDRLGEGTTLHNLGAVYFNLEQYQQALDYYQQALAIRREINDRQGEEATLHNLVFTYYKLGQYADAERYGFATIEVLESLRTRLADADKIAILDAQTDAYQILQLTLVAQQKYNTALEISERGRSRAFVELLAQRLSPETAQQATVKPPTLEQIQQIASQQNATLVEYSMIGDKFLYIWVIPPQGKIAFRSVELDSVEQSLSDLVQTSRTSMGVRGRASVGVVQKPGTQQKQKLQQLHELLIAPIAQLLPTNPEERIIFIPYQDLFLVPFPALQDNNNQYLVEQHTILTAPAIQILQLTHQQQPTADTAALVVGNPTMPSIGTPPVQLSPLPGAQKEALAIAKLLDTTALTGNQATKTIVIQKMANAKIIHLATHGLLDDFGFGIPGAVALAPTDSDNGLLSAGEILDLRLNTQLVVLSACDTGRGEISSDGVIGLSRSLILAGAPSVIVSLWLVPDAPTASLMIEFYRQLDQNQDKAQALRQAMLTTKQQHPNPRDWAAFTLIGES